MNAHRRFASTLTSTALAVALLASAGWGTHAWLRVRDYDAAHHEAAVAEQQTQFWQAAAGDAQPADGPAGELAAAIDAYRQRPVDAFPTDMELFLPADLADVYVAPDRLDGVSEQLGFSPFEGIASSGGTSVCADCGGFTDEFVTKVATLDGDYSLLLPDPVAYPAQPRPTWLPQWWQAFGALTVAGLAGYAAASRQYTNRRRRGPDETLRWGPRGGSLGAKSVVWLLAWPATIWRVLTAAPRAAYRRASAQRERRRVAVTLAQELAGNPVADELIRARANLAELRSMPSTATVRSAIERTEAVIAELERVPAELTVAEADRLAAHLLAEGDHLLDRRDALLAARDDLDRLLHPAALDAQDGSLTAGETQTGG